jgi:hypothetical protein
MVPCPAAFVTGSHKRSPLGHYLFDRLIPGGIGERNFSGEAGSRCVWLG